MQPAPEVSPSRMRTFLAVASTGSVRSAAAELHVTEPAVSTSLGQLRKVLGVDLVRREGRGLRLTAAGEVYADYCRTVMGLLEQAYAAVQSAEEGRLRLGAVATASEVVLPPALAAFRELHPRVELSLTVAPRDQLFDHLRHHEVDLVLGGRPPHGAGFALRATRPNTLIVVGAPGVRPDVAHTTWLMRSRGSGLRDTTLGLLNRLELDPPQLTLGTHGAVVASARSGLGITLVHHDAVADDLARGDLVQLDVPRTPMARPWVVATAAVAPSTTELFISHLTDQGVMGPSAFHPVDRPTG
ncbi:LysR family transcriptional regulator, low CO2-responsive transcriptional regulator [Marmoricola sp. URHA0025 HA25]